MNYFEILVKKGNEKFIQVFGRFVMVFDVDKLFFFEEGVISECWGVVGIIFMKFFVFYEIKQVEVYFIVGEVIIVVIVRWDFDFVKLIFDVEL